MRAVPMHCPHYFYRIMKKYIAELIGTFALVFCGTGSIIVDQQIGGVGLVGIALAFGLVISGMIYLFGSISGTHINPAVTLALAVRSEISAKDSVGYIISQIAGALLASASLHLLFPTNSGLGATLPSGSILQSFVMEVIMTFFLMLTILGVVSDDKNSSIAGLVIGLFVTGIIFVAGPVSGGSFNPARSIGPALVSGQLQHLWIYLVAPTAGAVLASITWSALSSKA